MIPLIRASPMPPDNSKAVIKALSNCIAHNSEGAKMSAQKNRPRVLLPIFKWIVSFKKSKRESEMPKKEVAKAKKAKNCAMAEMAGFFKA